MCAARLNSQTVFLYLNGATEPAGDRHALFSFPSLVNHIHVFCVPSINSELIGFGSSMLFLKRYGQAAWVWVHFDHFDLHSCEWARVGIVYSDGQSCPIDLTTVL